MLFIFMKLLYFLFGVLMATSTCVSCKEPIVTAKKYLEYKRICGHIGDFNAPETVLVCYQRSTMEYFLKYVSRISSLYGSNSFVFK